MVLVLKWYRSVIGHGKLKTDGSSSGNLDSSGGGGVIRDLAGSFLAGFYARYERGTNNRVELKAILDGLHSCLKLNYLSVDLETDSYSC